MAYKAATRIKFGKGDEVRLFEVGEAVTGLPVETMKELWEVGALEKVADPAPEPKKEAEQNPPPPPPPPSQDNGKKD